MNVIDTDNSGISKDTVFYGYRNTGEEQYATCNNIKINSAAEFIEQHGYKFKSLGTAPKTVSDTKYSKNRNSITMAWKAGSKSDGYVIYRKYNYNLIVVKKVKNGRKYSCTIKNNKLKGIKKLYIKPYKK